MVKSGKYDVLVLVDEDVTHDRRVLASLKDYPSAQVLDCRTVQTTGSLTRLYALFITIQVLIRALWEGSSFVRWLGRHYGVRLSSVNAGFLTSLRRFFQAQQLARTLRPHAEGVQLIHAHDWYCGVIGAELARISGVGLVYDAHEVEFHRNRKNSLLRLVFDWAAEKRVIEHAQAVWVVNTPIAQLYRDAYSIKTGVLHVVPNDHFPLHPIGTATLPSPASVALVYVGGGVQGRQLDQLAVAAAKAQIPVHAFFIGQIPTFAFAAGWKIGGKNYEEALVALATSQRCMMWCCVEHACLSYRLSLPNKFFQALAVGIPVIVSAGGYLEELIRRYEIGTVFDDNNFKEVVKQIESDQYQHWATQVKALRVGMNEGRIRL